MGEIEKLKRVRLRELFSYPAVFLAMRRILPIVLLFTLAGCASSTSSEPAPEQNQSAVTEPAETMDPMESESVDPMESENSQSTTSPSPTATAQPTQTATPTQTSSGYTLAEVAKRNTQAECWVAIDGGVYDLTDWIKKHPGGSGAISALCGTDGTSQFTSQHGGESRATSTLESYYLGALER